MSFDLNKRFWQEFIEIYRDYPCLWSIKSKEYSNKSLKHKGYFKLVEKCKEIDPNANIDFVKKKINNLRSAFRRELKKVEEAKRNGTAMDEIYKPTLWYYDLLLFIADDEAAGRRVCVNNLEEIESTADVRERERENADDYSQFSVPSPIGSPECIIVEERSLSSLSNESRRRIQSGLKSLKSKRKIAHKIYLNPYKEEDEYDVVGRRIAFQLRGSDENQRLIAEKLISEVMFHAKLRRLTEHTNLSNLMAPSAQLPATNYYTASQYSSNSFTN